MPADVCGSGIFFGVISLSAVLLLEYWILIPPFWCVPVMREFWISLKFKGEQRYFQTGKEAWGVILTGGWSVVIVESKMLLEC